MRGSKFIIYPSLEFYNNRHYFKILRTISFNVTTLACYRIIKVIQKVTGLSIRYNIKLEYLEEAIQ